MENKILENYGIYTFKDEELKSRVDELTYNEFHKSLKEGSPLFVSNKTKGLTYEVVQDLSTLDIELIKAGGTLNHIKLHS